MLTMKNYLLLRANEQSGPYSLTMLQQLPLRAGDLIWREGESERWEPATDRPELCAFVVAEPRREPLLTVRASHPNHEPAELTVPAISVRQEPFQPFRFQRAQKQAAGGLWIAALFLCLVGGAVVVKRVIDSGQVLARSSAVALATEPPRATHSDEDEVAGISYQHALRTETVRLERAPDPADLRLRDLRKFVHLTTNTDKEGVFEGISDLQIRIENKSEYSLGQVNVEVSYKMPGSAQWHKDSYSVNGVQPKQEKILVVPPVKRGAHVKYRLLGVEPVMTARQTPA